MRGRRNPRIGRATASARVPGVVGWMAMHYGFATAGIIEVQARADPPARAAAIPGAPGIAPGNDNENGCAMACVCSAQ